MRREPFGIQKFAPHCNIGNILLWLVHVQSLIIYINHVYLSNRIEADRRRNDCMTRRKRSPGSATQTNYGLLPEPKGDCLLPNWRCGLKYYPKDSRRSLIYGLGFWFARILESQGDVTPFKLHILGIIKRRSLLGRASGFVPASPHSVRSTVGHSPKANWPKRRCNIFWAAENNKILCA